MAAEKSQPSDLPAHPKYLHEDEELSQQCKHLISTLPAELGWMNIQLHYKGLRNVQLSEPLSSPRLRHSPCYPTQSRHHMTQSPSFWPFSIARLLAPAFKALRIPSPICSVARVYVKQLRCNIVYLCRNLKEQFVSLWHFANGLRLESQGPISIEDSFDKFFQGVVNAEPFWDHVLGYYEESKEKPDRIMFLRFEKLKDELDKILGNLAESMGLVFLWT
ncbi:hypothetical protein K1719_022750 [Acacia pycnantha]|nr:hypothetical protein K1719_022750 [Acacia pycnantha]